MHEGMFMYSYFETFFSYIVTARLTDGGSPGHTLPIDQ